MEEKLEKKICYIFRTFSNKSVAFCWKFFGWVAKTAFFVSIGKFWRYFFWRKVSFLDIKLFFCVLMSFLWWVCPNSILRIRRTFWGKVVFFEKYDYFPLFQDSEQKYFVLLPKKLSAGLSKQFTTCPSKSFDENRVFLKTKSLMNLFFEKTFISGPWNTFFLRFVELPLVGLS